jgi:hypothetical protein
VGGPACLPLDVRMPGGVIVRPRHDSPVGGFSAAIRRKTV